MTDLSPAAQVAIDAWWNASDGEYINGVWTPNRSAQLAAALQAVADEVVPERQEPAEPPGYGCGSEPPEYVGQWTCWNLRQKLLAIAAELRNTNPTTEKTND